MQVATEVTKATVVIAQTASVFLQAIEDAMKRFDESRSLRIMRDYIKNNEGELYSKVFDRRLVSQVQHALFYHDPPIPNAIFEDNISGKLTILFRDSDIVEVDKIFDAIKKRNKGLTSEKNIGKEDNGLFKIKLDNLSENERSAIVLNAKKKNLDISLYRNDDATYKIFFDANDQEKIDQIISNTYFETHGYGARFIDYHSNERMEAIKKQIDTGERVYLISPTNNAVFIMVDRSGFAVFKHNQPTLAVSRNQTSFQEDLFTAIHDNLTIPLAFNADQFEQLEDTLKEGRYQLMPTIPANDEKAKKFAEIERHVQHLVGLKMSIENDPATEIHLDFLNPDVSFEQFFHLESINDQNNVEILQNNKALMGLKKYYDTLSSEEKEYFYQFLAEYNNYVDKIHEKEEVNRTDVTPSLEDEIAYAEAHTADSFDIAEETAYDTLFDSPIDDE